MATDQNTVNSIFFNHSFDKKRLKALISWVFKQSGEAEALKVIDLLKETGFQHATKAGISIGLHDLATPIQKSWLISESQLAMNTTERDFAGARITAAERSQRIIDTWHRASESLSKQVVDYFGIYDKFNPVYIMALSGARGNFSQVRQLIGMRGLMADQQGKIVNFPIRSNLREGLTLTEYFISCSGARKGLVDTALRTADTGYLTRRLVDVSHHVVVKRIRCNTNRGISFKSLQSYNKTLLPLKERLVGRVLAEDIFCKLKPEQGVAVSDLWGFALPLELRSTASQQIFAPARSSSSRTIIAKKDQEISLKLALKIAEVREKVDLRSPLTCGFTQSVCQLCYGWSISQGSLVSLGDAVGVIAAQSIGEPGTQLTMRTFHTGGVFSGDLLQEIKAPHEGTIEFSRAFQGLLIRTAHGRIAFLSKTQGSLVVNGSELSCRGSQDQQTFTSIPIPAFTMLFVRQGEKVESNQLLAEFSIRTREGNQPIKTEQTIFAELSGRVVEDCTGKVYAKSIKESALFLDSLESNPPSLFEMQEELLVKGLPRVQSETRTFLQGKADFLPSKQKNETTLFRNSFLAYKANLSLSSFTVSKPYVTQVISSFSSYNGCISAQKVNGQGVSFPSFSNKSSCVQIKSANEGHKASLSMTLGGKATRLSGKRFVRIRHQNRTKQRLLKRFVITYGERGLWGFAPNPRQIFALPSKIPKTNLCFAKICKKICKPKAIKYFEANGAKLYKPQSMKIFTSSSYLGLRSTRHQSLDVIPFKRLFRFFCSKHQGKVYGERKNILYKIFSRYCAQLDQINRKKNDLYLDSYKQVVKQRKPSFVVGLPCGFRGASVTSANLLQIEDLYGKALTKLRFVRPNKIFDFKGQRFARRFVRLCPKSQIPNPKPTANLFFTKKSAVGLQQQEIQEDLYPQAKMKILNVVQGVQKKTLQNIFDTKLVRLDRSHNGKRFVFLNEMKKKQSVSCKAQILFLQKSEDLESDTFKYIEPVRSGRLGFLKILSMRVGATLDYASPLLASNPSKKTKKSMSIKASNETNSSFEKSTKRNVSFLKLTDKYLHPEFVKENRFLLQTIAEHGDILEEGYSYNS